MQAEHPVFTHDADFRQFVAARSPALLRTAYLLVGDWAHAEDVLQTALTKTYLAWRRLGQIEAVEAYTRRVLVTTATSWWRRRWHGEQPTESLPERAYPDQIDEHLQRQAMWRHVRALPARQRAVLVLRFYEDLTEVETAKVLGVAVGTVKSQCARALAALRVRLAEEGIEPAAIRVASLGAVAQTQRSGRSAAEPSEPDAARNDAADLALEDDVLDTGAPDQAALDHDLDRLRPLLPADPPLVERKA